MEYYQSNKIYKEEEQEIYCKDYGNYTMCIFINNRKKLRTFISLEPIEITMEWSKSEITEKYFINQLTRFIKIAGITNYNLKPKL
jgi:hypothetical protein